MFLRIFGFLGVLVSICMATPTININIQELSTPNGQKVWFVKNEHAPVFTLRLTFKNAGTKRETPKNYGVTTLLKDMLLEGSNGDNAKIFKRYCINENIELSINHDVDDMTLTLRTTKDKMEKALVLVGDILTHPTMNKDDLTKFKEQHTADLSQAQNSHGVIGGETLTSLTFGDHPYATKSADVLKTIPAITINDLKDYLKTYLSADSLVISVDGQVDETELLKQLDILIKKLPTKAPPLDVKDITLKTLPDVTYVYMDIPQSLILFNHPGLPRHHKDYYAFCIMLTILGDGNFESRLFKDIREERGLAYFISADIKNMPHVSMIYGSTACKTEHVNETITQIRAQFEKMKNHGVTENELTHNRDAMIGVYAQAFTESLRIVSLMDSYQLDNIPKNYVTERRKILEEITKADVDAAAKTYLFPEKLSFVVVGRHK